MTYRTRQRLFSLATPGPVHALAAVGAWWIVTGDNDRAIVVRTAILLVLDAILFGVVRYGPTRRRPARLYHLTTRAAADAATVAVRADGGLNVDLRARKPGKPTYFFPHPPQRPSVLYWTLRAEPDVCIELHDIDYSGVGIRRRLTGAYRLHGPITASATIHPFPMTPHSVVADDRRGSG